MAKGTASTLYLVCVLTERQGDKLLGESVPLAQGQRGQLGHVGVGHQGAAVRLVLYADVGGKLQARHARVGALSLGFGWRCVGVLGRVVGVGEGGVTEGFGGKRRRQRVFVVMKRRMNREWDFERR